MRNTQIKYVVSVVVMGCMLMGLAVQAAAETGHLPAIINIVLDASGSVSHEDFHTANAKVADFAELMYERSQVHPGKRSDWLMVNWFGGAERSLDYDGTRFINCSDLGGMSALYGALSNKRHPRHNYTAIYSSIVMATNEVIDWDSRLPGPYAKVVILVTDGEENDSPAQAKRSVKQFFPNDEFFLFVIGVGEKAQVKEFQKVADGVVKIDNFDGLLAALTLSLELYPLSEQLQRELTYY